jgi:tetratricopeptide (TPR) repeat protein
MADDKAANARLATVFKRLLVKASGGVARVGLDVAGSTIFMGAWPLVKAAVEPVIALIEGELEERITDSPAAAERGAEVLAGSEQLQALLRDGLVRQLAQVDETTRRTDANVQTVMTLVAGVEDRLRDIDGRLVGIEELTSRVVDGEGVRLSSESIRQVADAVREELARGARVVELATGSPGGVAAPGRPLWLPFPLVDRQVARINARAVELVEAAEPARALDELEDGMLLLGELLRQTPSSPRLRLHAGYLRKTTALAREAAGDPGGAREELERAAELFQLVADEEGGEGLAEAINGLGSSLAGLGRYAEALPLHRRAAALAPTYVYAWHDVLAAHINLMSGGQPVDVEEMRTALEQIEQLGGGAIPGIGRGHLELLRAGVERATQAAAAGLPPGPTADRVLELSDRLAGDVEGAERADLLLERASRYAVLGRSDAAVADLDGVIAIDDRRARALTARAAIRVQQGRPEAALADLDRAVALEYGDPDTPPPKERAQREVGDAEAGMLGAHRKAGGADTLLLRARARREAGEPDGALSDAVEAARLDPGSAAAELERGRALGVLGRFDEALAALDRALALSPGALEARAVRAATACAAGRLDEALDDVDAALAAGAEPGLLALRGSIHSAQERPREAVADLEQALRLQPGEVSWRRALAAALAAAGEPERAVREWAAVLAEQPDDLDGRRSRALLCLRLGRPDDALADCDAILERDPDDPILFVRALGRRVAGDYASCVADLDRCLALGRPEPSGVLQARARCHVAAGDLEAAVADFDRAIAGGAGADARAERGRARAELGDLDGAIDDLAEVWEADRSDPDVAIALGGAYHGRGRLDEAALVFEQAVQAAPRHTGLRRLRAAGRFELGHRQAALDDLDELMRHEPDERSLLEFRAVVRTALWLFDQALADIEAMLARGDDPRALQLRAQVALFQGRPLDALIDLDRALAALPADDPGGRLMRLDRAVVQAELGAYDEAEADLGEAAKVAEPSTPHWLARAMVRRHQGRAAEAVADLERAVAEHPDVAEIRYLLALAAWEARETETADGAIAAALQSVDAELDEPADVPPWLAGLRAGQYRVAAGDAAATERYREALAAGAPQSAVRVALEELNRLTEHARRAERRLPVGEPAALLRGALAAPPP